MHSDNRDDDDQIYIYWRINVLTMSSFDEITIPFLTHRAIQSQAAMTTFGLN